ncbi:right-handed parallel beta-helix repeat-containing protein [Amycolatopsis sp. NPDC051106]|uniref:right-handed parallel beta-helix repeat-containing protein n=1 Tax=unclassified Amycolatopsis TaxID=2618356 RepID=UPI00343CB88A
MSIRVLAGVALLVAAAAGPTAEGAAGPGPRTRRAGPHGTYPSVQAAADAARPGDTVAIEAGSYPGGLTVHRGGAPGHPIRFTGIGGTAVLTGAGGLAVGRHSWLEFTDVTVSGSSDVEVSGCRVHDNGEEGIDVKYDDAARVKIHHNVVTGNRGPDIYVDSLSTVDVYANVVGGTREATKAGIGLAVEDYSESRLLSDIRVVDNLSTGNAQAGLSLWVESAGAMRDLKIVNDPARDDYHLAARSAAVDAGSPEHAPGFDLDGVARAAGAGFDIGAYERRWP